MDLRSLRNYVVVAQELNITHAAEKLNMSQPPLSAQIRALEDELGAKLFIRGKRSLKLTEAGTILYRRALQILELTKKTEQELIQLKCGVSGNISVGLVGGRTPYMFARWSRDFCKKYPLVTFKLRNGSTDEVVSQLTQGLSDIAVIAAPYDLETLEGFPVGRASWTAVIPRSHPLARQEGSFVDLADLKDEPLIVPARKSRQQAIYSWFAEVGAEPNFVCETAVYLDAVALTEQGLGISIFPQSTYTPNDLVVTKVIRNPERQIQYVLAWNKDAYITPAAQQFIDYVRALPEISGSAPDSDEYTPPENTPYL